MDFARGALMHLGSMAVCYGCRASTLATNQVVQVASYARVETCGEMRFWVAFLAHPLRQKMASSTAETV